MAASRPVTRLPAVQAGEPLPLPFEAIDSSPSTPTMSPVLPAARATAPRRWLAVALPELVLESHIDPSQRAVEAAIIAEESGQLSVRAMTPAAAEQGVADGMTLAAAMALVPGLRLYTFFPDRVVQCRNALLQMALTFTPTVVCHRADVLLLEIGASRRLFGGFDRLLALLAHELQQRSHDFATAMAPTPRAAAWLAHSRPGAVVDDTDQLDAALRDVSLSALGWPDDVLRRLAAMGVRSLGDCRRLPRTGFAKRFGPARLLELDRAYGQSADPQQAYQPDEPFVARLELTAEIANKARLVGMAAILLERLARFARRRQRCVRALRFTFYAIDAPATVRVIRPGVLAQEIGHWQRLLELDLEPVDFAAPTILIELTVSAFEPLRARNGALPLSSDRPSEDVQAAATQLLLSRLRARLGRESVKALRLYADHRPERAMQLSDPEWVTAASRVGLSPWRELALPESAPLILQRPLWLLREPKPFSELFSETKQPVLCHGPERIETGWWDGAEVCRDYYMARVVDGRRAWVFRERTGTAPHWYVHGFFG